MSLTTSPMRPAACDSSAIRALVFCAWVTAWRTMVFDSCTCRLISLIEEVISLVAEATDETFAEHSSEALATMVESCCVVFAVLESPLAGGATQADRLRTPHCRPIRRRPAQCRIQRFQGEDRRRRGACAGLGWPSCRNRLADDLQRPSRFLFQRYHNQTIRHDERDRKDQQSWRCHHGDCRLH